MGEFRFRLPDDWCLTSRRATSIHIVGIDGIPWPVRVSTEYDDSVIVVRRNRDESGKLFVSYPFKDFGEFTICTGSLPERHHPYDLVVELARGNLNRLRTQISVWSEGGLRIGGTIDQQTSETIDLLGKAILSADLTERDELAAQSLEQSMGTLFQLSRIFGDQVSNFRVTQDAFTKFWIAFNAGIPDRPCLESVATLAGKKCFDFAHVSPRWIEAGARQGESDAGDAEQCFDMISSGGTGIIAGPLLDASAAGMPADLVALDDFEARRSRMLGNCRDVLRNLPDPTGFLHVACGLNGMGHRQLSYPQQLQVVSELMNLIDDLQVGVPNILSFDYPWAERMATSVGGIHPLQIADTLLRQGLRINYLGMDINLDYWPGGSVIRDPLQWIDLIDVWSQLGLPLVMFVRLPLDRDISDHDTDTSRNGNQGGTNQPNGKQLVFKQRSNLNDQQRLDFLRDVLPVVFARPNVHGLVLRQLTDAQDQRFPGAGITLADGNSKAIVELIENLEQKFLQPR